MNKTLRYVEKKQKKHAFSFTDTDAETLISKDRANASVRGNDVKVKRKRLFSLMKLNIL